MSALAAATILGYLLGSIPFGLLLALLAGAGDIRRIGSGSIGATNVLRTGHKGLAAATVLLDGGKGAAAVAAGRLVAGGAHAAEMGALLGGLAAVAGHMFPVWLKFRGGKGVATGFGVLLAAMPVVGATAGLVWLAVALAVRISSASALVASAAAPLLAWLLGKKPEAIATVLVIAILIFIRHHANIARLLAGTEPRIGSRT
jgi:acyl phosphate:glycerol-3-phosphate acyltransferase